MKKLIAFSLLGIMLIQSFCVCFATDAHTAYMYGWYSDNAATPNDNVKSYIATEPTVTGGHSLYMQHNDKGQEWKAAAVAQNITLTEGTYTLSLWVAGQYDSAMSAVIFEGDEWQEHKLNTFETGTEEINYFKQFTKTISVPAGKTNGKIRIVTNGNSAGFYVDNISLMKTGTSTELITNGSFEKTSDATAPDETDDPVIPGESEKGDEAYLYNWYRDNAATENENVKSYIATKPATGENSLYVQHNDGTQMWSAVAVSQDITLTEGTYTLSFWLSGTYDGGMATIVFQGDDWQTHKFNDGYTIGTEEVNGFKKFTKTITIAEGKTNTKIRILSDGNTQGFYIDDISLIKTGAKENIIKNGGFEDKEDTTGSGEQEKPEIPVIPGESEKGDEAYLYGWYRDNAATENEKVKSHIDECYSASGYNSLYMQHNDENQVWNAVSVTQDITLTEGTYTLSFWLSGTYDGGMATIVFQGDDWQTHKFNDGYTVGTEEVNGFKKFTKTITVAEGKTNTKISILSDGNTQGFYIDDISLIKTGTEENIIKNGGFEETSQEDSDVSEPSDYEIGKVILKKENQRKLYLDGAGNYSISFYVKNNAFVDGLNVVQLVAIYDESGALHDKVCSTSATIEKTNEGEAFSEITTPFVLPEGQYTVEFFAFDGRNTLNIIGDPNPHKIFGYDKTAEAAEAK